LVKKESLLIKEIIRGKGMKLSSKIIISAVALGVIGGVSTPFIYQSQVDKFLNKQKQALQSFDVQVNEKLREDSFLDIKREYILTITDITPIVKKLYPNIDEHDLKNLKEAFDNTKFLIKINLLKYPVYHKNAVEASLYALNGELTRKMKRDKVGRQFLDYIKNKAFAVNIALDNFGIAKVKAKDLNINLSESSPYKREEINLITKKVVFINGKTKKFNTDKISFEYSKIYRDSKRKYLYSYEMNHITYNFSKLNDLNYKTKLFVKDILFKSKTPYESQNFNANINNIEIDNKMNTDSKGINISNKFSVDSAKLSGNKDYIKVNKFVFNANISQIDAQAFKNLTKVRNDDTPEEYALKILAFKNLTKVRNDDTPEEYALKILNHGFKIEVKPLSLQKADINMLNQKLLIGPILVNFGVTIKPNNLDEYLNKKNILNYLNAKLYLETTQKNIDLLTKQNPDILSTISPAMQKKNNKIIFDVKYKNSHIYSRGIKLY